MANFRSILEINADEWLDAMGLTADEIPDAVIVEGIDFSHKSNHNSAKPQKMLEAVNSRRFPISKTAQHLLRLSKNILDF